MEQYRKKGSSFLRWILAAAMLMQTLCFPVHTAHATETDGAAEENVTLNQVMITWGDMAFMYGASSGDAEWTPLSENSNRITVTNLNADAAMRAAFKYTPAPGNTNVVANLTINMPEGEEPRYPVQNLAMNTAKVDASPLNANSSENEKNTFTAYLQLTGAPTASPSPAEGTVVPLGTLACRAFYC